MKVPAERGLFYLKQLKAVFLQGYNKASQSGVYF